MAEKKELHAGYLLHQRPYRESSVLAEIFTRSQGRVACVGRGMRKVGRRGRSAQLTNFRPYLFAWGGRGDLVTLHHAEAEAAAHALRGDAIYAGLYANELLIRLCARFDPHPELYAAYERLLEALALGMAADVELRYFECDLLAETGYGINLEYEADTGEPIGALMRYAFQPEIGAIRLCGTHRTDKTVQGATLLALAARNLQETHHRREARGILREALHAVLGPQPLKSLETLRRMQKLKTRNSDE